MLAGITKISNWGHLLRNFKMQYLFCKDAVYALQAEKLKSVLRADPSVYQAPALVQIQNFIQSSVCLIVLLGHFFTTYILYMMVSAS